MSDTPRTDAADLYDYQTAVEVCGQLERELAEAREALRDVISKFPRCYPAPCEFHATIDVTSEELARWKKAAK